MSKRFKVLEKPGRDLFTIETRQTERGARDVSVKVSGLVSRKAHLLSPRRLRRSIKAPIIMLPAAFLTQEYEGSFRISLQDGQVEFEPMDEEFERLSAKAHFVCL